MPAAIAAAQDKIQQQAASIGDTEEPRRKSPKREGEYTGDVHMKEGASKADSQVASSLAQHAEDLRNMRSPSSSVIGLCCDMLW